MTDIDRKDLYRRIGLRSPAGNVEPTQNHEELKAACSTALDAFEAAIYDLVIEKKLSRAATGQAALFTVEVLLGVALRNAEITPAEVRSLYEQSLEHTLDAGVR